MSRVVAGSNRTASPAPKAAAAQIPEERSAKAAEATEAPEAEKEILGLHPQAFYAIVVAPVCIIALFALALGPGRGRVTSGVSFIISKWNTVSDPIEQLLAERADIIMILAAMTAFTPILYLILVTFIRALGDLRNFTALQQLGFVSLVAGSVASFVFTTKGRLWNSEDVKSKWDKISDPLEKAMVEHADYIVAGCAVMAWMPIMYCVGVIVFRLVWNCAVPEDDGVTVQKLSVDEVAAPVAVPSTSTKRRD